MISFLDPITADPAMDHLWAARARLVAQLEAEEDIEHVAELGPLHQHCQVIRRHASRRRRRCQRD